jgi:phosphotransferase system enzyme I (PtsI)
MSSEAREARGQRMKRLEGLSVSPGMAMGKAAVVLEAGPLDAPVYRIEPEDTEGEIRRFELARERARDDLRHVVERIRTDIGSQEAAIFEVHLALLDDESLQREVVEYIPKNHVNVEAALAQTIQKYRSLFLTLTDSYARTKASDILDVGKRLLGKLLYIEGHIALPEGEQVIIVAYDLSPALLGQLDQENILGLITEVGSPTSHGAILARTLDIPALINVKGAINEIATADTVILDGVEGTAYVHPTQELVEHYQAAISSYRAYSKGLGALAELPAITRDGQEITLAANASSRQEIAMAVKYGAAGIGLYRTEFPFLAGERFPEEEQQFEDLREAAERLEGRELVVRVLDIGGDKFLPYFPLPEQTNPYLGWRGLRILLEHENILRTQLRALLRASAYGSVRLLVPMLTSIEELHKVKDLINQVKAELDQEGTNYDPALRIGAMVEVPATVFIAEHLVQEVDFLSIGTNDLVQYLLAVDRADGRMAHLYDPLHPGVLAALKRLLDTGASYGIEITLCGEMAGNPFYTPLLLGLGLRRLSMVPAAIPYVKEVVRGVYLHECTHLAEQALKESTSSAITSLLRRRLY